MLNDLKATLKDSGILLFAVIVPLLYPLLYSFIYTNEVVTEVPVCAVDMSNSVESREFIRKYDATPEVDIVCKVNDLHEAKRLMAQQKVNGIIYFPSDFSERLQKMQQSAVQLYCDMGFILYYKATYLAATNVMLSIKHPLVANNPDAIQVNEVQMFNNPGGYGNFLLQAILPLLIQQTLLLAFCTEAGTRRQKRLPELGIKSMLRKGAGYITLYTLVGGYLIFVVPFIFGFTQMISIGAFFAFLFPTLLSMMAMGLFISLFMRHRETPLLYIAFTSIIFLFLTGASWPENAMPEFWQYVAWLLPSTPSVRAFIKLNAMGAELRIVWHYLVIMLVQAFCYFGLFIIFKKILQKYNRILIIDKY